MAPGLEDPEGFLPKDTESIARVLHPTLLKGKKLPSAVPRTPWHWDEVRSRFCPAASARATAGRKPLCLSVHGSSAH